MTSIEKVLVVGATGGTGLRLVTALRRNGFRVRALIRDASKAALLDADGSGGKVEIAVGDAASPGDVDRAVEGVQGVLCAIGSRAMGDPAKAEAIEHLAVARLARAAAGAGVQHFVLCSSMGVETPELLPPLAVVLRAKRKGELALIDSGVPYTIVRPGGLLDSPGGSPADFHRDVKAAPRLAAFGAIPRDDVAEVMVQALLQPEARNKTVEIIRQPGGGPATPAGLFA